MNTVRADIKRFDRASDFAQAAAQATADALRTTLAASASAVLAVPGGSTATTVLPLLKNASLPWDRIRVTLTDERWVAPEHSDSNEKLVTHLLQGFGKVKIVGLYTGDVTPHAALGTLETTTSAPDIALLGMGIDGHIASLFPNDPANRATGRFAAAMRSDHPRISLTPAALANVPTLILAFAGAAKERIFEQALADGPREAIPVRHILHRNAQVFVGPGA